MFFEIFSYSSPNAQQHRFKRKNAAQKKAFPLVGKVGNSLANWSDEGICREATKGLPSGYGFAVRQYISAFSPSATPYPSRRHISNIFLRGSPIIIKIALR